MIIKLFRMKTFFKKYVKQNLSKKMLFCVVIFSFIHFTTFAQNNISPSETVSAFFNPLFVVLLIIAILLLIAIVIFADVVKAAAYNRMEKEKKNTNQSSALKSFFVIAIVGYGSNLLYAQASDIQYTQFNNTYYGLDSAVLYSMLVIIGLEIFILWSLYNISMQLIDASERKEQIEAEKLKNNIKQPSFIEKINASVAIEKEADILLDHNYDGIHELDNNLPPWWKYSFYLTILFSIFYLIHFHITHTGKLQVSEYEDQLMEAKLQVENYKKKAANLIDENNATLLTDETSLAAGKSAFLDNCVACHGRLGEGGVGPNLIDDYWLHGGSIKDIFKIIKYGWPEKGMKSWQQDLGAKQIHEIASYIKSLHGTQPINAKEKQGDFYREENIADSIRTIFIDSTKLVAKENIK